jgi:hypothetical protein
MQSETEGSAVQIRRSSHCRIVGSLIRHAGILRFWTVKNVCRSLRMVLRSHFAALFCIAEELFYCPSKFFKESVYMKKTIAMAAAMLISFSAVSMNVFADDADSTQVYVTITDNNKAFVLNQEPITVTDIDEDGKLTINDALFIAHEEKFDGGAEAGYKTSVSEWGLSLDMLWGIDNKGSYGYYVNDGFSMGLADEIKDGDYIEAFIYPDPKNYNYYYSFFDSKNTDEKDQDSEIDLTLAYYTFGADSNLVTNKLEGAKITINGKETDFVTDADGKVTVKLTEAGKNVISAVSDSVDIVPCKRKGRSCYNFHRNNNF